MIYKAPLLIAAVILLIVCLLVPAAHWASIPQAPEAKILTGLIALAFGICKVIFWPLAIKQTTRLAAVVLAFAALCFTFVSINSTVAFLKTQSAISAQVGLEKSREFKANQSALLLINEQIKTQQKLIDLDINNGYRTRAINSQSVLAGLIEKRQQLNITKPIENNTTPFFYGPYTELLIAVFLHVACILSVLLLGPWAVKNDKTSLKPKTETIKRLETETKPTLNQTTKPTNNKAETMLNKEQNELAESIKAGEFGDKPSIKKLIQAKAIKGGFNKIKPVFDELIAKNKMRKTASGYELIQKTI